MKARHIIALVVLVLAPSLSIRLYPVTSESFQHDAIVSQAAAADGVTANAWDHPETFENRRFHPPLLSYVILANNAVFGGGEYRTRFFSIIAGALACLAVALSTYFILGQGTLALVGAVFGGWMLCLLPVHLYVSRTANWDAIYSLFSVCTMLGLSVYLQAPKLRTLVWTGIFAALTLLTCELGLVMLPAFAAVFLVVLRKSTRRGAVWRDWTILFAVTLAAIAILWPAGVLKLDYLRTLRFRLYDSSALESNEPWYRFYTILFEQAPAYTIAMVAGIIAAIGLALRRVRGKQDVGHESKTVLFALLPFVLYAVMVVLLSTRQRLVYIHHIADLFPALTVVAVVSLVAGLRRTPSKRVAAAAIAVVTFLGCAAAAFNPDPRVVGPQEHAGYLGIRDFLTGQPGAATYYHYDYAMHYYLPDADVRSGGGRWWTPEKLEGLKRGEFDFVVFDWSMFDERYPSIHEVAGALEPDYEVVHVVRHRRTGEAVAWIFTRD